MIFSVICSHPINIRHQVYNPTYQLELQVGKDCINKSVLGSTIDNQIKSNQQQANKLLKLRKQKFEGVSFRKVLETNWGFCNQILKKKTKSILKNI